MRHKVKRQKLNNRDSSHRNLLIRNLVTSLILFEKIKTTPAKARMTSSAFEKIMTTARKKDLKNAIRFLESFLLHEKASRKTLEVLKKRYEKKTSGFTRLTKIEPRVGDGSKLVQIELI